MNHRIVRIGPLQAGKIGGVLYFLLGLIFVPFVLVGAVLGQDASGMAAFALVVPFLYGALGFVFTALAAAAYNVIAGFVGGLEITVEARTTDHG